MNFSPLRLSVPGILGLQLVCVAALCGPSLVAQERAAFQLDAGSHELPDVVSAIGGYLGRNILLDPAECQAGGKGPVRFSEAVSVNPTGAIELLNVVLHVRNMAVLPVNEDLDIYEVISMAGPRRGEVSTAAKFVSAAEVQRYAKLSATPIIATLPLDHINATVANNAMRPFFSQGMGSSNGGGINIGNVGDQRWLLVQGFGSQVAAVARLLKEVDVPPLESGPKSLEVIRLQNANAAALAQTLRELFGQQPGMAGQQYNPEKPIRIVADVPTNAIVVQATPSEIANVKNTIAQLDRAGEAPAPGLEARVAELERQLKQALQRLGSPGGGK